MACKSCDRDKPIKARGLCGACYQRWRTTGTTEYQRWGKQSLCSIEGCNSKVVSHHLCDKHRKRLERHGHVKQTRPDSWGAIQKHPLGHSWYWLKRQSGSLGNEWGDDFLQFVMDVGERPSSKHKLFRADETRPIGPDNFVWKRSVTEKVNGEDRKTYQARRQRVYRSLKPESYKGYDLKRHFGISKAEYDVMHEAQDGKCLICGESESNEIRGKVVGLAVDHCHDSGKVRGLLCSNCNRGIGLLKDDPELLEKAVQYLKK